jgi:hypothetical protein
LFIKNAICTVDGTDVSDAVDNVKVDPQTTTNTWEPISGNTKSESITKWTCTFNLEQDFKAGSLWMKLFSGTAEMTLVFKPRGAEVGGAVITVKVMPSPAGLGGGQGTASATATLGVNGTPAITPAAA